MLIKALQKLTVIDYPGKLACSFFLFGCNFRCSFCHNPELVFPLTQSRITEKEALTFLESRKTYLDGVCFTGGEPLASLDKAFVRKVKQMGFAVKIDTNGSFPDRLLEFVREGLVDYVAMDVKTTKKKYASLVGAAVDISKLEKSMQIIAALPAYEFRCTIIPDYHAVKDVEEMKEWLLQVTRKKQLNAFYVQGFVARPGEMVGKDFDTTRSPTHEELKAMQEVFMPVCQTCVIRS